MALTTIPASLSATALTLTTAAQPNITSVGTLTGLTVSGNIAGTLTTAAQTNITSVGTLTGLNLSGGLTGTTAVFTTANQDSGITIECTNDGTSAGPSLKLDRSSSGPANDDDLGEIEFRGRNNAGESTQYARITSTILDVTDGAESGSINLTAILAGTKRSRFFSNATETVINEGGQALDFRVESDNKTNALFIKGSDGDVGIGTTSPTAELHINATSEDVILKLTRDTNYGVQITGTNGATNPILRLATINNGTTTERLRMTETDLRPTTDQGMGLGTASVRYNGLHVKSTTSENIHIRGENTTADIPFQLARFETTVSGTGNLTGDRAQYGIYSTLESSATGGDTSNEHRLYGIRSLVKATGDSDQIFGMYSSAEATHNSGTVSLLYGSYNHGIVDPESGGTVSNTYASFNQASIAGDAGSTVTHAYAGYNKVLLNTTDVVAHSSLTGCYAEIETDASGTGRTTTSGFLFRGVYDDDSGAEHKFTNFYGLNLAGTNLTTRVDGTGNVAGVYLDMPGVDQGFWNSEDQPNHFRGSLSIGSGGRQVGDTVGAELHLVEPDGGELVLARYDASIGTNNSLGKILFGGTEDTGTTVNFSASIQAFAQSAHSTTDADGYLSFYTTAQSSTTLQEQLRVDRTGTIKVIRGDIQMPTGQGISFVNAADTATGETVSSSVLDDYEEGTFNGQIISETGSITTDSTANLCTYTKIGRLVTVTGRVGVNSISNPGGQLYVGGLPFNLYNAGENAFSGAVVVNIYNAATNFGGETVGEMTTTAGARILIRGNGATTASVHTAAANIDGGSLIGFTATYPAS
jgi:hypothetical protein